MFKSIVVFLTFISISFSIPKAVESNYIVPDTNSSLYIDNHAQQESFRKHTVTSCFNQEIKADLDSGEDQAQDLSDFDTIGFAVTAGSTNIEHCYSIRSISDGGFIAQGITRGFGGGGKDFFQTKYDSTGNLVWACTTGGTSDEYCFVGDVTTNGDFIAGGWTESFGAGNKDLLLIKHDPNGNLTWARTAGGASDDCCLTVQSTEDGGFIAGGWTESFGAGNKDLLLIKYDASGNEVWARTAGGADDEDCSSILLTSDGGFISGGTTSTFGAGWYDFLLIKYDASGNLIWARTTGRTDGDMIQSIQSTTDGGFFVGGMTNNFSSDDDFFLVKYDAIGNVIWARMVGGTEGELLHSIQSTDDGGVIAAGSTRSFNSMGWDTLIVKLNSEGQLVWSRKITRTDYVSGGNIDAAEDGGFLLGGSQGPDFGIDETDFFLLKTDSNMMIPGCSMIQTVSPTLIDVTELISTSSESLSVFNPSITISDVTGTISSSFVTPDQEQLCYYIPPPTPTITPTPPSTQTPIPIPSTQPKGTGLLLALIGGAIAINVVKRK